MSLIDNYFDKVFYLNLDKDIDRNENILSQFKKYDINNFERISGVVFDEIPDKYLWRNFIDERDAAFHVLGLDKTKHILGQLGCRASHLSAIRVAKERGYKRIIIFEDDILILGNPNNIIKRNFELINGSDMSYFGGNLETYYHQHITLGHAYAILNTALLDDILYMAEASGMEIDNFYAKVIHHMSYNYNTPAKYRISMLDPFNTIISDSSFKSNSK